MLGTLSEETPTVCSYCGMTSNACCRCPCSKAFYCNSECQHKDWNAHRGTCTSARRGPAPLASCLQCGAVSADLMNCVCEQALYCSVACQQLHWGTHRRVCRDWMLLSTDLTNTASAGVQTDECPGRQTLRQVLGQPARTTTPAQTPPSRRLSAQSQPRPKAGADWLDKDGAGHRPQHPTHEQPTPDGDRTPSPKRAAAHASSPNASADPTEEPTAVDQGDIRLTLWGDTEHGPAGGNNGSSIAHLPRLCEEEEAAHRQDLHHELDGAFALLCTLYEEQHKSADRKGLLLAERAGRVTVVKNWTLATQRLWAQARTARGTANTPVKAPAPPEASPTP